MLVSIQKVADGDIPPAKPLATPNLQRTAWGLSQKNNHCGNRDW
jgi:hypothetical protein